MSRNVVNMMLRSVVEGLTCDSDDDDDGSDDEKGLRWNGGRRMWLGKGWPGGGELHHELRICSLSLTGSV